MDRRILQQRTKQFNINVIKLCENLPKNAAGFEIAKQVIRSAGSVGANYRASARAKSKADFINKIQIIIEEADETQYWLEVVRDADLLKGIELDRLITEANELTAIFTATNKTAKSNNEKSIIDLKSYIIHNQTYLMFLQRRNRILRANPAIRSLVAETLLTPNDFIAPLFIDEGDNVQTEIASMPNYYRRSIDLTVKEVKELYSMGIKSALLFIKCKDELKDNTGKEAWNKDGLMQRSIKAIKDAVPEMYIMTDVALDPYSSYGHDGIVENGEIINDPTVEALVKMSISHAEAGVDMVAPSDMMDGRIGAIRAGLEGSGFTKVGIMAYSAKYASCFYGPFRDALDSAPGFGDKKTYQMDYSNRIEAVKEALMDVEEGADIVMVKPGLPYLDIVREVKNAVDVPVSVYNISGEYAMIKAAAKMGWVNEDKAVLEILTGFKRAGADLIATYFAKDAARILSS